MGIDDKISNATQDIVGKVKEGIGDATDNERLEAEGRADQAEATVSKGVEYMKDGVKNAADKVKDAVD